MNEIRWYWVGLLSLLLAVAPRLRAQEPAPGDVGTPECVYLQNTVHDDLRMESEQWRNHGELMKRVQEIVSPELEAGNITEECSSCITKQYALDIDSDLQEPCGPPENLDERFARIADRVPGFGGMFRDDEQDTVMIYLVDPAQRDAAIQALQASFGPERVPADHVQVLQGDYDFRHLKTWKDRLTPLLSNSAVFSTDVDEATNRLAVGTDESSGQIIDTSQLDIPPEAILLRGDEPPVPDSLQSHHRPLVGGLVISRESPNGLRACTLGFNADLWQYSFFYSFPLRRFVLARKARHGFVTNSHCTATRSVVDGTVFHQHAPQPWPSGTDNRVGLEYRDPAWFTGGRCPAGKLCRYSDSAFVESPHPAGPPVARSQGTIALTAPGSTAWNGISTYRIVAIGEPLMGETVHKVGAFGGTTSGRVRATCADQSVWDRNTGAETNMMLLCQGYAAYIHDEGDSGSPVFRVISGTNDVVLYGIHWGGGFSLIQYVKSELLARNLLLPESMAGICAPGFAC